MGKLCNIVKWTWCLMYLGFITTEPVAWIAGTGSKARSRTGLKLQFYTTIMHKYLKWMVFYVDGISLTWMVLYLDNEYTWSENYLDLTTKQTTL